MTADEPCLLRWQKLAETGMCYTSLHGDPPLHTSPHRSGIILLMTYLDCAGGSSVALRPKAIADVARQAPGSGAGNLRLACLRAGCSWLGAVGSGRLGKSPA